MNAELVAYITSIIFVVSAVWGMILLWSGRSNYGKVRIAAILYSIAWATAMVTYAAHTIDDVSTVWYLIDFIKMGMCALSTGMAFGHLSTLTKPAPRLSARKRAKLDRQRADQEAQRIHAEIMKELHKDYPLDTYKYPL